MIKVNLTGSWQLRQTDTDEWLPAQVPGCVHTDLLVAGRIPDPFVADNEKQVQWVSATDWEYRRTFAVSDEMLAHDQLYLVCDGLDTLAEVWLNGHLLDGTDNMYRRYCWDVTSLLRPGSNEVSIKFASPTKYVTERQHQRPMMGVEPAIAGGPHLRKAPCQFGWDWGPRLPSMGIWQDIRLEGYNIARLDDVHLRQQHSDNRVTLTATVRVDRWQDEALIAELHLTSPNDESYTAQAALDDSSTDLSLTIDQPQLWYPNGYGSQPLYEIVVTLKQGDQCLDQWDYKIGLRTLELRQEEDAWGKSFTFVVNGLPIFAKGANWIPADSFPNRISDEQLESLIRDAAATHQNMIRVWGGGFYEEERFYDLCDQYGLLVWQDFVFACAIYPLDEADFVETIRREVIDNIRRLRHRASLALWCGNNEMEWGWVEWGWDVTTPEAVATFRNHPHIKSAGYTAEQVTALSAETKAAYDQFFHTTLPAWCAIEDPDTSYWPSSPSSDEPFEAPNGQATGDAHYWEVWHGRKPFTAYRSQFPRFMSEFGFQSLPPLETVRSFAAEADWNLTSYIMDFHQRSEVGNGVIISQMAETFRLPKDFPALVYLSMVLQAEGIRYGVEHWRRNMHRVSGALYWQLNDCWPVASWSSIDYFGRWKALHYAAKNFFAPVMLSIEDAPPTMGLHLTSDLTEPWSGEIRWSLETLTGQVLKSGQETAQTAPLSSTPICSLDFTADIADDNQRNVIFVAELWQADRLLSRRIATFVPSKHLTLTNPDITAELLPAGDELAVQLTASSLARFVEVSLEGIDVVFSDNYFDLPAGRTTRITCSLPAGWTVDRVQDALRVWSLYDTFG